MPKLARVSTNFLLAITIAAFLFAACSNQTEAPAQSKAPPAPTLNLDYLAIKVFSFSWADSEDETGYKLLEDESGSGVFEEIAAIPENAEDYETEVFLPGKISAGYKLAACNDAGCSESAAVYVEASQLVKAMGYFKASNAEAGDEYGKSLAISADGKTIAIGAALEDGTTGNPGDNSLPNSGAVYVFIRNDAGQWVQEAYLKASNAESEDRFGTTLALSADGDTLAVSALLEDSNATGIGGDESNNDSSSSGAVYIFVRDGSSWNQQAYIKASNTGAGDYFGHSLALADDGNTLAVGAPNEDSDAKGVNGDENNNNAINSGAVYVFARNAAGAWSQQAYIKASNTRSGYAFGNVVTLSGDGNTLAVGSPYESSEAKGVNGDESNHQSIGSGAVYVFTRDVITWSQKAYIKASNTESRDFFGSALDISDDGATLAVGAYNEDSGAPGINGDQEDNSEPDSGAVYVFEHSGATWSQQSYIKASNTEAGDNFGASLSLSASGDKLIVGASLESSNATGIFTDGAPLQNNDASSSGAAYIFVREGDNSWSQQAYVKASNSESGDCFGFAVAISADGSTAVAGSPYENSSADRIGGSQNDNSALKSGAAYVF